MSFYLANIPTIARNQQHIIVLAAISRKILTVHFVKHLQTNCEMYTILKRVSMKFWLIEINPLTSVPAIKKRI